MIRDTRTTTTSLRELLVTTLDVGDLPALAAPGRAQAQNRHVAEDDRTTFAYSSTSWTGRDLAGKPVTDPERQLPPFLANGWPAGAAKARALAAELTALVPPPVDRRRRQVWSDDGDTLDLDRAWAGQWETAYRTSKRTTAAGQPVVSIAATWGVSCSVSDEALYWNGAAALALADLLEDAGYRVELLAVAPGHTNSSKTHGCVTVVTIKGADEPLRPDAVAAVLCNVSIFRYYGLLGLAASAGTVSRLLGHWDWKAADALALAVQATGAVERPGVIIEAAYTREAAARVVRAALATLAGEQPGGEVY